MTSATEPSPHTVGTARLFDRFSVGMYSAFLLWNWLLYSFGPAVQLLGGDLGFSASAIGLHGVALAVGTALAGVVLPHAVRALGRRGALLCGAVLVAGGAVALTALPNLVGTMAATLVLALGGNLAIASAQAGLVLHHTVHASTSVATANGLGTLVGLFGPLLIGASVAAGWGWRPVVLATVPLATLVAVRWLRMAPGPALTPRADPRTTAPRVGPSARRAADGGGRPDIVPRPRNPLAASGWWFLLAALTGVAIENATTFWALTLVVDRTGAGAGLAAAAGAAFVAGMALSRLTSRVATARRPPEVVVVGAFVVTVAGWLVLWLATAPAVAVVGLAVAGAGCGLLYPLSASLLLSVARGSTDAAQGVIMLAIGVAVGVVPFALGVLAGVTGVHTAFLIVPALAILGLTAARLGARRMRR